MTRNELLAALKSGLTIERASAICMGNIIGTFTWSGLSATERERITRLFETLSTAADKRARQLQRLIDRVQGGSQDVF